MIYFSDLDYERVRATSGVSKEHLELALAHDREWQFKGKTTNANNAARERRMLLRIVDALLRERDADRGGR